MNNQEIWGKLQPFLDELQGGVTSAFLTGRAIGEQRFKSWRARLGSFLRELGLDAFYGELSNLSLPSWNRQTWETDVQYFWERSGQKAEAILVSLMMDISAGQITFPSMNQSKITDSAEVDFPPNVFLVHGHDHAILHNCARLIKTLGLNPVILSEMPNLGKTVIEKLEHCQGDIGFAIVLFTEDDQGSLKGDALKARARQNVILECGFMIGLLGRDRVAIISSSEIEAPSDLNGVVYLNQDWRLEVARELKAAGYEVDLNKLSA